MNDEPRFMGLIAEWIADGSVPSYPAFSGETEEKRKKRKRKFEKENTECDALKNELGIGKYWLSSYHYRCVCVCLTVCVGLCIEIKSSTILHMFHPVC